MAQQHPALSRSILITGASTGIGLAAAVTLKQRGWRVLATARKAEDIERLRSLGLEVLPLELADSSSIAVCASETLRLTEGKITALYNNAAYGQVGAMEDITADVLRQQLEVNVIGTHDLTRRLIPAMRANGQGRIVQCSSVLGLVSGPYRGAYSASKFALEGLSDAMRIELAGTGIHVSLIEPGPIRTNFIPTALLMLQKNVDIKASAHASTYASRLDSMKTGGKSTFKLEPDAVVARLIHALESPRPKPRYFVTVPTHIAAIAKRLLSTRLLDRLTRGQ